MQKHERNEVEQAKVHKSAESTRREWDSDDDNSNIELKRIENDR